MTTPASSFLLFWRSIVEIAKTKVLLVSTLPIYNPSATPFLYTIYPAPSFSLAIAIKIGFVTEHLPPLAFIHVYLHNTQVSDLAWLDEKSYDSTTGEGSVGVGVSTTARTGKHDREGHDEAQVRESEWLEIGLGAQILKDLGITSIKLLSSRERHYVGLEGFGIKISETDII